MQDFEKVKKDLKYFRNCVDNCIFDPSILKAGLILSGKKTTTGFLLLQSYQVLQYRALSER